MFSNKASENIIDIFGGFILALRQLSAILILFATFAFRQAFKQRLNHIIRIIDDKRSIVSRNLFISLFFYILIQLFQIADGFADLTFFKRFNGIFVVFQEFFIEFLIDSAFI